MIISSEGREEQGQGHDEASDDGREPGRLPPAKRDQKWRHQVGNAEISGTDPNCNKRIKNNFDCHDFLVIFNRKFNSC